MNLHLIITTYNRDEYFQRCLECLMQSDLSKVSKVTIVDDASTDIDFGRVPKTWDIIGKHKNKGIKDSLLIGFDKAFSEGADVVMNLDGDSLVRRDFVDRIIDLHKKFKYGIVSGFNCTRINPNGRPVNKVKESESWYSVKESINGINVCFNRATYIAVVRSILSGNSGNWDYSLTGEATLATTVPSVVQHIGVVSSMGHSGSPDVAYDFRPLYLPDVTLLGIDRNFKRGLEWAHIKSRERVLFGNEVIIYDHDFWDKSEGIEGYSRWCIEGMVEHVNTSHVLIIHPDGFVQNPYAWKDEWLEYDYIGAKWGYDTNNVGNGGFSLRSKKLLLALKELKFDKYHPEDDVICRDKRAELEAMGIKFAPDEVADEFSVEGWFHKDHTVMYSGSFGFHGYGVFGLPAKPKRG